MPYMSFDGNRRRLMTVTFGVPEAMYRAMAVELHRPGDYATDAEIEEYLRDVLKQNIEFMVESHLPKKKPLMLRKSRP